MRKISKGSIEKRGTGKFRLKVTVTHDDGTVERVSKNVECRTKTEAAEELDRWRQEMRTSGEAAVTGDITLKDFLWEHVAYLHDVKGLSPNTLRGYRDIVTNRWSPNIGTMRLRDVTPRTIEQQLAWLKVEGGRNGRAVSGTTCQKAYSFLKTALKHAVRLGYISSNPCDTLDAPTKNKTEVTVLDEAEVARMKELVKGHPDYRFAMAVNLSLDTGMRRGEACALRWADVDLNGARLHVRHALAEASEEDTGNGSTLELKDPKSATSNRVVSLSPETVAMLRRHKEQQRYRLAYFGIGQTEETPVLCDNMGELYRPSNYTSHFDAMRRAHSFDITLHGLRHTHASLLLKHGVPIQYVSQRLGHENIQITYKIYAHFLPGDDGGSADVWQSVFGAEKSQNAGFPSAA